MIAERRFEGAADGFAFVEVTLLDVEPQRTHVVEFRTNGCQRSAKVFQALAELTADVASADDVLFCVPGNLAGHIHDVAKRRGDGRNLRKPVAQAIENSDRNMHRSAHERFPWPERQSAAPSVAQKASKR
ncbi:hypothetical protein ACNJYA_35400 [Bradyrhizobium sp. DASA03068]|uniref:hypothetical protein n=1 Tax=Bradyrhizobium sp. BLXBL-01 TaxID=3395915 RepID=UPI003F71B4CB